MNLSKNRYYGKFDQIRSKSNKKSTIYDPLKEPMDINKIYGTTDLRK